MRRAAFSLVELSIVLVILGLLVGGILAGQSLIRAAELRSISTDSSRILTGISAFRDKYMGLPGDITNAESFWGTRDPVNATCRTTPTTTGTATCNGDGNGVIESFRAPRAMENFRAWQHLANAGLIEGTYTGVSGANHVSEDGEIGWNVPAGRIQGTGWSFNPLGVIPTSNTMYFPGKYGNVIQFGTDSNGMYGVALTPAEAWSVDRKMDDGLPALGIVVGTKQGSTVAGNCTTGTTIDATYDLVREGKECSLSMKTGY